MHSSATLTIDLSRPVKSWNKNTLTRAEHLIEAFLLGSPRGCNLTSMAHISHHRHDQRWCNFFKLVPLFAQRTQNFGLFWPIHKNQVMCKPSIMVLQRYPTFSTTTTTPPVQLLLLAHQLPGDEDAEQPVHPALSVHKILVDEDSHFGLGELNMDSHFGWLAEYMCFSKRFW